MDTSQINFGTDGWRGVIAEDFTFDNVRACAQGVASYHQERGGTGPLVVGYDTRFASGTFAAAAAEVLTANGLSVLLCVEPTPTPVVSHTVIQRAARGGVVITASHNPAEWNGFKYRTHYGGSPPPEVLTAIEGHIGALRDPGDVRRMPAEQARAEGLLSDVDPRAGYLEQLGQLVDLTVVRESGLRVVIDAMHGAGAGYLPELLGGGSCQVTEVRGERNPAFPEMHNPEPVAHNLAPLRGGVADGTADVGLALDGDADRLGAVDEMGRFITPLQVFALLVYYLLEVRGQRGPIVKSVTTGSMIWRLGERYGVPVHETGVGFKYIAPLMVAEDALIGGEESGGYALRGHLPERDGILSGLLLLDLMARTGKRLPELLEELYGLIGTHHFSRVDVRIDAGERRRVEARLEEASPAELAGLRVTGRDTLDGVRYVLEGGAWVIIRPSGTEPLLRLYAEAETPQRVESLLAAARGLVRA